MQNNHPTPITQEEIIQAQHAWASNIVGIGKAFMAHGDYKSLAIDHLNSLYAFDEINVLFKPTLASICQFRTSFSEALSYFIGGDIEEDNGFAIRPWSKIHFAEQNMIIQENFAVAMGNYFLTEAKSGEEIKVEYTFVYIKDAQNKLRIITHHSSLPYYPA